jgi:hypothetical protein
MQLRAATIAMVATVAFSHLVRQSVAQECAALGGTCNLCLQHEGCDWCELDGACFPRGTKACNDADLRAIDSEGGADINHDGDIDTQDLFGICANKCTSQTCWLEHSHCQMEPLEDGTEQPSCFCDQGYNAEGVAGHATLCVVPAHQTKVVGRCIDAAEDPEECDQERLADRFNGCGAKRGYSNMASVCRASCGAYCADPSNICISTDGTVDYAQFYCISVEEGNCQDTTAIDYACPHHSIGSVVPAVCDDVRTDRDDGCAEEFMRWWDRCKSTLTGIPKATMKQLTGFYAQCQDTITAAVAADPCSSGPCLNGGMCSNGDDDTDDGSGHRILQDDALYACSCTSGFAGSICGGGGGTTPPPPATSGTCGYDVCGTTEQVSTDGPGTTYRLSLVLSGNAKNVYTIYGDDISSLSMPPSYQEATPWGANIGGANPVFFAAKPGAEFDGWLTVGITGGDAAGDLSSINLDFDDWTASSGLTADNGAVFWIHPNDGPTGTAVIAQVTVSGGFTAVVSCQGRSTRGKDYQATGINFTV